TASSSSPRSLPRASAPRDRGRGPGDRPRAPFCYIAPAMICADASQCAQLLVQVLLIGISNGAVIALIALGYTLVYGIIEFINFAHGDLFMLGTMFSLTMVQTFALRRTTPGLQLTLALIGIWVLATVFCAVANVLIER